MKNTQDTMGISFNPKPSTILHIDLNSCFATIEQQANPHLRGRPIAVAAYTTSNGCIVAPSVEAKKFGVKTGMRVRDGKALCPDLVILEPDPWKYRNVHLKFRKLLANYSLEVTPKSIDEFVMVKDSPYPLEIAQGIKRRIKEEIGEWLTVSIGVAPNRFLAKLASNLDKPDGLREINKDNFSDVYSRLNLTDLPYIKTRNAARLNSVGIYTVLDFYNAPLWKLKSAFQSINGYYWYLRVRGWEIDNVEFGRRSYGNSYALPRSYYKLSDLSPILSKLVVKMSSRLRQAGYYAQGVHLAVSYRDGSSWHKGEKTKQVIFETRDIYKHAHNILMKSPRRPVRDMSVSCFNLLKSDSVQLGLFEDISKKKSLTDSIDKINNRWGNYVITSARILYADKNSVPDRIAFGGVKELEEFSLREKKFE